MCSCEQSSQRATCPPSAAVRQRAITLITFNCVRLMCPARAHQSGPSTRDWTSLWPKPDAYPLAVSSGEKSQPPGSALTYPRSCGREGASLVWNAECSRESPLSTEAKSPRLTAQTRHLKPRNKSLFSATPDTSAPIAERFSARAPLCKRYRAGTGPRDKAILTQCFANCRFGVVDNNISFRFGQAERWGKAKDIALWHRPTNNTLTDKTGRHRCANTG